MPEEVRRTDPARCERNPFSSLVGYYLGPEGQDSWVRVAMSCALALGEPGGSAALKRLPC